MMSHHGQYSIALLYVKYYQLDSEELRSLFIFHKRDAWLSRQRILFSLVPIDSAQQGINVLVYSNSRVQFCVIFYFSIVIQMYIVALLSRVFYMCAIFNRSFMLVLIVVFFSVSTQKQLSEKSQMMLKVTFQLNFLVYSLITM